MVHNRVSRIGLRLALAAILVIGVVTPASAHSVDVTVLPSSPLQVTVGKPVAYPISVVNSGKNTVNHITVTGVAPAGFTFLFATPTDACSQTPQVCDFRQVASGAPLPLITFYYRVPTTPGNYDFQVEIKVAEGGNDNSDGTSNNIDTFPSDPVRTVVRDFDDDFVAGHSVPGTRSFTTGGIDCAGANLPANCNDANFALSQTNPHGSAVVVASNAEVTVSDVGPANDCPATITSCFGSGTDLSIANGTPIPGGIAVTMRWDYSELPSGMTAKKLNVIHLFDTPTNIDNDPELEEFALITDPCSADTPVHCFVVEPFKLGDKDIQATFLLPFNGVSKGW